MSSPDVVLVAILRFLNDKLSIKQDEAAHDEQPQVHVCLPENVTLHKRHVKVCTSRRTAGQTFSVCKNLEQHQRSEEHVHHRHQQEQGKARHQRA